MRRSLPALVALAALILFACGSRGRGAGGGGGGPGGGDGEGGGGGEGEGGGEGGGETPAGFDDHVLASTPIGTLVQVRYDVPGRPFDTTTDYIDGPATWRNIYGQHRQFHPVRRPEGPGVVWQDRENWAPQVTWFSDVDPESSITLTLPSVEGAVMAAAGSDNQGNLYVLLIQQGDGAPDDVREGWLLKTDSGAGELGRQPLDTSKEGLNMVLFGSQLSTSNQASLKWSGGVLCVMLARKMTRSGDGLNHQGGIALIYDAQTLLRTHHLGQTSGHSFGNVLSVEGDRSFIGLDLGDNYPRGVHVHRMIDGGRVSRVVYTFKTQHGGTPASPSGAEYDLYEEISGDGGSFYKWSNDNRTYTELGGLVKTSAGMTALITTERSGLDNSRVGEALNDPRDIALIQVRSDLPNASQGGGANVVTDDLVLSVGEPAEEGGFFDFGGGWQPQRNAGVVWLTDHSDVGKNASRVKLHPVPGDEDGRLVVMWELWAPNRYLDTFAMVVTPAGDVVAPATSLGDRVRLGRRDDPFSMAGGVANIQGVGGPDGALIVNILIP